MDRDGLGVLGQPCGGEVALEGEEVGLAVGPRDEAVEGGTDVVGELAHAACFRSRCWGDVTDTRSAAGRPASVMPT